MTFPFARFIRTRRTRVHLRRLRTSMLFGGMAIVVGLVTVLYGMLMHAGEDAFADLLYDVEWAAFIVTPLGGMAILWLMRRWFAGTEGGGIPQVMAEMSRTEHDRWPALVSLRIAIGKVLLSSAAVGAGFSLGREAPSVQVGASLMVYLERWLPRAAHIKRHHLLVAGGAAGLAAAFNTPLGGVMFAIEELQRTFIARLTGIIITAIVLAGFVARALEGNQSYYGQVLIAGTNTTVIGIVLLSAIVSGIGGGVLCRLLTRWNTRQDTWLSRLRARHPYLLVAICGLLIAALGYASGGMAHGTGFAQTGDLLRENAEVPWYYGPVKFLATAISGLSGLPGGTFGPSLAIGAGIGSDLALLFDDPSLNGMLIVFGMVGFLAAVTQAPITAFVIVMEMVDGYRLVIGLMLCAILSANISRAIAPTMYHYLAESLLRKQRAAAKADQPS
jgi:H+/Cl- antiporter ClcA